MCLQNVEKNTYWTNKSVLQVYCKCIALNSFHFPLFVEEWIFWNPLWVYLKQTRANNCPPLPMRLLCLGVWSKTLYIWEFQKTVSQNCIANDCFSCTTSARTQDLFLLLSDFSTNFHPFAMRAFFITSIVSFLVLFLGIEKKDNFFIFYLLFFFY